MASPSVRAATFSAESVDTTSHDVDLTGIQPGDRAMFYITLDTDGTVAVLSGLPAGWSLVASGDNTGGGGFQYAVYEKLDCSGSEVSFSITSSISQTSKTRTVFISGSSSATAAEASTVAKAADNNPDATTVTPSGGSADYLWLTFYAVGNARGSVSAYPTNYTHAQYSDTTNNAADAESVNYGLAARQSTGSSEDAGSFTKPASDRWAAITVAVSPATTTTSSVLPASETNTAQSINFGLGDTWPSAPSGFTAFSPTSSQVDLAWNEVTDAQGRVVGYDIDRRTLDGPGGSPTTSWTNIATNVLDTVYSDIGLALITTYEYRLRATIVPALLVSQAAEENAAYPLTPSQTTVQITLAAETDTARIITSFLSGGGGGYGAGDTNAPVTVPASAVTATPATLASLINSNSGGTTFALQPGTYNGNYPNKAGNRYIGNGTYTQIVFSGNVTYPNLNDGTAPNGGTQIMMTGASNNVWANMTIQRYRGANDGNGNGPITVTGGSSGCLVRNVLFQHNAQSGWRWAGSNHEMRYVTSRYNGRYCVGGSGTAIHHYNCDFYSSGDGNMKSQGQTPRVSDSNRGISKFVQSNTIQVHTCHIHDINDSSAKGLWWDINNSNCLVENSLFEDLYRNGAFFELSHGGIIRNNTFNHAGYGALQYAWSPAAILIATGGVSEIYGNTIQGGSNHGIILYQNNRDTAGDNQHPEYWDGLCGSNIHDNIVQNITNSVIGTHCVYTKDGCNFNSNPGSVTISNNTTPGSGLQFWANSAITKSAWNALGYS